MRRWHDEQQEEEDRRRQTRGLAGLALILLLAVIASYLIIRLRQEGIIEDCLLAQRIDCDALVEPH